MNILVMAGCFIIGLAIGLVVIRFSAKTTRKRIEEAVKKAERENLLDEQNVEDK